MNENQYCEICKTEHPVEEFEHVSGGWVNDGDVSRNWFTLKCLRTGKEFSIYFDEPVDDDEQDGQS